MHVTIYNFVINLLFSRRVVFFFYYYENGNEWKKERKEKCSWNEPSAFVKRKFELGTLNIIYMCDSSKPFTWKYFHSFPLFFNPFLPVYHVLACDATLSTTLRPQLRILKVFSYFIMNGNHFLSTDS